MVKTQMKIDPSSLLVAVAEGNANAIVREAAQILGMSMGCPSPHWAVLSLGQSASVPRGQFWGDYSVPTREQERVLQRGPFRLACLVPTVPSRVSREALLDLAPGSLDQIFTDEAYLVPIASPLTVSFDRAPAALLIVGGHLPNEPSPEAVAIAQMACGVAQRERATREVESRIRESDLQDLAAIVASATSRKRVCEAVLDELHSFLPFEAGVLYLLDPDPGRNEYLVYGASRNENDDHLFASYCSRSDLGFMWEVAMERQPRAGSVADVPGSARHTNRSALGHVTSRYEAWAVVPFTLCGSTRAVAHIEGVRFLEGASLADLLLLRQLGERLGNLIDRRLKALPKQRGDQLIGTVEALRSIARTSGPDKRTRLESFTRELFSQLPKVVGVHHESRTIPQIDGMFLLKDSEQRFVVEVKAPDDNDSRLGKEVVDQITGQMEAVGAERGLIVTTARFSLRVNDIVPSGFSITVLDGPRLERFCVLAPDERRDLLLRWLAGDTGVEAASFA